MAIDTTAWLATDAAADLHSRRDENVVTKCNLHYSLPTVKAQLPEALCAHPTQEPRPFLFPHATNRPSATHPTTKLETAEPRIRSKYTCLPLTCLTYASQPVPQRCKPKSSHRSCADFLPQQGYQSDHYGHKQRMIARQHLEELTQPLFQFFNVA